MAPARRPSAARTTAEDALTLGPVHLDITDEARSRGFWQGLIGLREVDRRGEAIHLGVDDAELVVLHPGAVRPAAGRGRTGLYHLAIHLSSEADFARVLGRIAQARYPQSPTDHVMHWATYLDDPDGIGLELSFETIDRVDQFTTVGGRPMVVDRDGRLRSGVEALDLQEVFAHLGDGSYERPMAPEARIGHVHLTVSDLERSLAFYADVVGFTPAIVAPAHGAGDMSAGGSFPHRLALNVWQGPDARPAPPGTAGLRHFEIRAHDGSGRADGALRHDPAGNAFTLSA
ncbi:MAG TPA: VOC family protein [Baekduia sp.]|nr:VOC family protein [Baekduia sp.]